MFHEAFDLPAHDRAGCLECASTMLGLPLNIPRPCPSSNRNLRHFLFVEGGDHTAAAFIQASMSGNGSNRESLAARETTIAVESGIYRAPADARRRSCAAGPEVPPGATEASASASAPTFSPPATSASAPPRCRPFGPIQRYTHGKSA